MTPLSLALPVWPPWADDLAQWLFLVAVAALALVAIEGMRRAAGRGGE